MRGNRGDRDRDRKSEEYDKAWQNRQFRFDGTAVNTDEIINHEI